MDDRANKRALDDAPIETREQSKQTKGMHMCCGCGESNVKYRCPRCERITCSLQCCVAHKKQYECNGKRDRTKFVEIKQFTDADLSSDFFFLEEVLRSTNSAKRSRSHLNVNTRRHSRNKKRKVATDDRINPDVPADWIARFPIPVRLFAKHSAKRGVALTLLAPGMSKRTRNSSYIDTKKNTLYWRVEWSFPSAEVSISLSEERANERDTLFALLGKYLNPSMSNVGTRGKLKKYARDDWEKRTLLLLRKEFTPASQPQYYRLDGKQSLESNLKRKAVVEFPVIIVVLAADADKYPTAHDVIEIMSSAAVNPTEHQLSLEKQAMETVTSSGEVSSELLTCEGSNSTAKFLSVVEEGNDGIKPLQQHKSMMIEEIQVTAH